VAYDGEGELVSSGPFSGMESEKARKEITAELHKKKKGKRAVNFRLRDWLISRQRFWGTPIPVIYCEKCGTLAVPEKDLPVRLPDEIHFSDVKNPLTEYKPFLEVKCHKCGGKATRETDTMDTFANSSWYYLRYADPQNKKTIFDSKKANHWCPVDQYIGGKEHACLHLIYIRFYTKFLRDLGLLKFDEPALKLFNQGMLLGPDGEKMSKSKGNVVLPEVVSEKYGIDTARLFLVSVAGPDKDINWSDQGIEGSMRFVRRIFDTVQGIAKGKSTPKLQSKLHKMIKGVTEDIEQMKYNLAVIKLREFTESLEEEISSEDLRSYLKILAPFAPHLAEELWEMNKGKGFISLAEWPAFDAKKIDEKLDALEEMNEKLRKDILEVISLLKIPRPKEVKIILADAWKYDLAKKYRSASEKSDDMKMIISEIMKSDLKKHGQDVMKIVQSYSKDSSKLPSSDIKREDEEKNISSFIGKLEKELGCSIAVELAEKSSEQKARNALPGKPAIVLS